ncbi:hypothetical protein JCM8097_002670 [Rhodosporidiobolus ruineniae]
MSTSAPPYTYSGPAPRQRIKIQPTRDLDAPGTLLHDHINSSFGKERHVALSYAVTLDPMHDAAAQSLHLNFPVKGKWRLDNISIDEQHCFNLHFCPEPEHNGRSICVGWRLAASISSGVGNRVSLIEEDGFYHELPSTEDLEFRRVWPFVDQFVFDRECTAVQGLKDAHFDPTTHREFFFELAMRLPADSDMWKS